MCLKEKKYHNNEWSGNMNQLKDYVIALTNLYGIVHRDKVLEVYNSQNKNQMNQVDLDELIRTSAIDLENAFVHIHKDYFVHETILENNDFDWLLSRKTTKPYYVPQKEELLNYVNDKYFERNKQFNDLLVYLERNFFKPGDEKADWLAQDIQGMCQFGVNIQIIMESFNDMNVSFKDMDQMNEVVELVMALSNNARIWENNGFTPAELFKAYESDMLKPLPNSPFEATNMVDFKTKKTVGRNDPCPCGSGKKYKKCCLGKED